MIKSSINIREMYITADCFDVVIEDEEIRKISNLGLAHLGDAVYELLIRAWLCRKGYAMSNKLHNAAVKYVSAPAQAKAMTKIEPILTDEERDVYRRGRNAHVNGIPQKSTIGEYHAATGLETLFGYLYLKNRRGRIDELFGIIMEEE